MTTRNKIVGTNFLKSKYVLAELTLADLQYLNEQNITCYQCEFFYESQYIFTSYQRYKRYMLNHYSNKDLRDKLKDDEIPYLEEQLGKKVTTLDIIDYVSSEVMMEDLIDQYGAGRRLFI